MTKRRLAKRIYKSALNGFTFTAFKSISNSGAKRLVVDKVEEHCNELLAATNAITTYEASNSNTGVQLI